jgi:hypothetical protein
MLIAEDLLLLLTRDDSGSLLVSDYQVDPALAGALLLELALQGRVDVAGEGEAVKPGRVVVRDGSTTGDDLLDRTLAGLAASKPRKPKDHLGAMAKGLRPALYARLADQGAVRLEEGRVLGVIPRKRWPAADTAREGVTRAHLEEALLGTTTPEPRTAALVALLHAVGAVPKVVDPKAHGVTRRELGARAKVLAEGNWASKAVRQAIEEVVGAVVAATTAAVVVSSGAG